MLPPLAYPMIDAEPAPMRVIDRRVEPAFDAADFPGFTAEQIGRRFGCSSSRASPAMTATSQCLETAPRRSLAEYRLDLITRRLDLMSYERAARDKALACAREIRAIERRLEIIKGAEAAR